MRFSPFLVALLFFSEFCFSVYSAEPAKNFEQNDLKVLDAALVNLVGVKGEKEFVGHTLKAEAPRAFYFNRMAESDLNPDPSFLIRRNGWEKLEKFDREKVEVAMKAWVKRSKEKTPFKKYKSTNKSIAVVDAVAEFEEKKDYLASYPLQGWSPGYSDDGRLAVLVLHLPGLGHSSSNALFLLEQKDKTWKVVYRYVATYL